MAFATPADRLALNTSFADVTFTVQIITHDHREVEIAADDIDHALYIQADWLRRGARQVEIFRILHDGTLNPTIGPVTAE